MSSSQVLNCACVNSKPLTDATSSQPNIYRLDFWAQYHLLKLLEVVFIFSNLVNILTINLCRQLLIALIDDISSIRLLKESIQGAASGPTSLLNSFVSLANEQDSNGVDVESWLLISFSKANELSI
jgi:hypothetical protein